MSSIHNKLKGGDLRSIGKANTIVSEIANQKEFDKVFKGLFDDDRLVIMRSADAVEKITVSHPEYLGKYKYKLIELMQTANHIELKWHLAQLMSRLELDEKETGIVWDKLTQWANDKKGIRIARVFSLQTLFDIQKQYPELKKDFMDTLAKLDRENIPSIKARIRKLRKDKSL